MNPLFWILITSAGLILKALSSATKKPNNIVPKTVIIDSTKKATPVSPTTAYKTTTVSTAPKTPTAKGANTTTGYRTTTVSSAPKTVVIDDDVVRAQIIAEQINKQQDAQNEILKAIAKKTQATSSTLVRNLGRG